jgi:hypothetical protein
MQTVDEEVHPLLVTERISANNGCTEKLLLIRQGCTGFGFLVVHEIAIHRHAKVVVGKLGTIVVPGVKRSRVGVSVVQAFAVAEARRRRCVFNVAGTLSVFPFPKTLRDNLQRGHVDRRVRVEAIPPVAVDDHAAFDGEFLNLVLGVDAPANATVCAIMGPRKALDLAATLDEPLFHAFL